MLIVFCVGASKAPPVLYLLYSTGRRYFCSLRYLLCTYAYNKLLMAREGVLYAEYSTPSRAITITQCHRSFHHFAQAEKESNGKVLEVFSAAGNVLTKKQSMLKVDLIS